MSQVRVTCRTRAGGSQRRRRRQLGRLPRLHGRSSGRTCVWRLPLLRSWPVDWQLRHSMSELGGRCELVASDDVMLCRTRLMCGAAVVQAALTRCHAPPAHRQQRHGICSCCQLICAHLRHVDAACTCTAGSDQNLQSSRHCRQRRQRWPSHTPRWQRSWPAASRWWRPAWTGCGARSRRRRCRRSPGS